MTGRALLVFVSARTLAATVALLLLAAAFASCGDAQEEVGPDTQPSATVSPSSSPIAPTATPVITTEPSTAPVPSGWQTYVAPVLAFSLVHPSDLAFKDLTGPSAPDGMNQRVIEFRSPQDPARGIAISVS